MEKTSVMRKRVWLFTIILACFFSVQVLAQEAVINISFKNVSLHEILMELKKQSGKQILYNNNLIEKYSNESIEIKNLRWDEALKKILEGKNLQYKLVEGVIVIESMKEKQEKENPKELRQTLKGAVIDGSTNLPLIGATIVVLGADKSLGAVTGLDGSFKIPNIPVGRQTVEVSYVGYKKKQFENVMILSAKENVLNAALEESVEKLAEVKITAYSKNEAMNEMAAVSARAFTIEETERFAGSWGDPSRMATNYAGVFTAGDQRNDIIIRGNSPTGLLWQLEDVPIPSPNHYDVLGTTGGTISMLNNNVLAQSDFFTSAFPSEFGNATSGVFDLKMRNGNAEKREYLAQLGFNGFEGGAEGPISAESKSSYIVNVRYSMLGLVRKFLWVDGLPEYKDMNFKLNFPLKSGKISVFGIGGTSSISMNENDDRRTNAVDEFKLRSLNGSQTGVVEINYHHVFSSGILFKTALAVSSRGPHELVDSTLNSNVYLHLDDNSYKQNEITFTSKLGKKFSAKNTVSLGTIVQNMSFEAERMTSNDVGFTVTIDEPYKVIASNKVLCQLYVEWKHKFTDELSMQAGANGMFFFLNNTKALDPRLGISWQANERNSFGLGYGLHSQIQPLHVYFIQSKLGVNADGRQVYADLGTNKNLDFTKSHQWVISHNYSFNPNLRLKTEAYFQYLYQVPVKASKGYFSMINSGAAMSVPEEDSLVNEGFGKNYGIEFTLEKFLSQHYYFLITTSLFNSRYQGSDKKWRNTAYNGHFVLNMLGGYEYEIKQNTSLNINLRTIYAGGRRLIPYDIEKSKEQNDTYYLYDQAYEKQVKNYFRMDLRIGVLFQRKKSTHELALDIVNVTNHKNVYRDRYDNVNQKAKISYQQGIFPMGLYRVNF